MSRNETEQVTTRQLNRQLLSLAIPLIISNSFTTIQLTVDRAMLTLDDPDAMGASFPAAMLYWMFFSIISGVASFTATFVAQYAGAKMPSRIGPAVWQGLYFAFMAGALFLLVAIPIGHAVIANSGHPVKMQALERAYFDMLCLGALPSAVLAAVSGFFSGRGDSWSVLLLNGLATLVNIVLDYVLIYGKLGFPKMGITGAGLATAIGAFVAAAAGLAWFLMHRDRQQFGTRDARFDQKLFTRLLQFGGPAGLQMQMETLTFALFVLLVGRLGEINNNATSLAFTLNLIAFLPAIGFGQAVMILVGQRQGEQRSDLAERSAYLGFAWCFGYMSLIACFYVLFPQQLLVLMGSEVKPENFTALRQIVPSLLIFVAAYSLVDCGNVVFAFALRGAGDTRFVTLISVLLAFPIMVIPSYLFTGPWRDWVVAQSSSNAEMVAHPSLYWSWMAATLYVFAIAFTFALRFYSGVWKSMRVIEEHVIDGETDERVDR